MDYKGYSIILNESKKSKDVTVIFLSARAKSTKKDSNSMFFFEDAAKKAGVKMITIDPSSASISGNDGKHKIIDHSDGKNEYTVSPQNCVVFTRRTCLKNSESKDFVRELERLGYIMINSLDTMEICEDKFVTYKKLKAANISTPQTVVISSSSMNKLDEKVQSIGGRFPIVAKILEGTQGSGVMIFESMMSLKSALQAIFTLVPKADILLQEKINSDCDYRIHVLYDGFDRVSSVDNYKVIGCMQRNVMEGDFRSNFSLGATTEKGHLTPELEKISKQAAFAVKGRWVGVDVIMDSGTKQCYVLEINSSPGTKGITNTGDDVVGEIFNMIKNDFKYTKYDSDQIGKFETVTIKNLDCDAVMNFDSNKTFTEMMCSSVNMKNDDTVAYVYNGVTYTADMSGVKRNEPMIELNIKFNGIVYKNELVILKQTNDSKILNTMVGGSRFINRISDNGIVVDDSFILTDNTLNFKVPSEIVEEGLLTEGMNWLFGVNDEEIRLAGLRNLIMTFITGSRGAYTRKKWTIESEENKDNWVLSYNSKKFLECKDSNIYFLNNYMPFKLACKIAGVIESIMDKVVDMSQYPEAEEN